MQNDRPPPRVAYEKGARIAGSGWFGRVVAVVAGAIVFVAAAMLSIVLLAVMFGVGAIVAGYFWWKIRALRKHVQEFGYDGRTIDVEVVHKEDSPEDDSAKR
jgi:4-hydroxybenzoate polyprenyltransferase